MVWRGPESSGIARYAPPCPAGLHRPALCCLAFHAPYTTGCRASAGKPLTGAEATKKKKQFVSFALVIHAVPRPRVIDYLSGSAGLNAVSFIAGCALDLEFEPEPMERAVEMLDFYHGSEHVWALGRTLKGEKGASAWVEPLLPQLRHGKEKKALKEIAGIHVPRGERGERVGREQNYFASHEHRMNYHEVAGPRLAHWERSGQPVANANDVSKDPDNFGRPKGCEISVPWRKSDTIITGNNYGQHPDRSSVKMRTIVGNSPQFEPTQQREIG